MQMMTGAQAHVGMAKKFNQFSDQGHEVLEHACANCMRKHYGGPLSCNDGWPCGDRNWQDRGARCVNWTNQGNAPV